MLISGLITGMRAAVAMEPGSVQMVMTIRQH